MNIRLVIIDIIVMVVLGWVFKKEFDTYRIGKRYRPSDNAINLFIVVTLGFMEAINFGMFIADLYEVKYSLLGLIIATLGYVGMVAYRGYMKHR